VSARRLPAGAHVRSTTGLSLRALRARPLRSLLTAVAVVLGVGMVFGVLLLVGTLHSSFTQMFDAFYGRTDVVVSGRQSIGSVPDRTLQQVRGTDGVQSASPQIRGVFRLVGAGGRVLRGQDAQVYVAGVDFAQPDPTNSTEVAGRNPVAGRGEIELPADWAGRHDLGVGDVLRVATPTGVRALRVSGLYRFANGADVGGYGTGAMPITDARAVMDRPSGLDEIDVVAAGSTDPAVLRDRLAARLGDGVEVATPKTRTADVQDQLRSFDVVLYFFSGIAVFVGAFLILNSFSMTVLQRLREIGTLRALGAPDRRVARGILTEAALLGLVGSVAGLALGAVLAGLLLQAMKAFGLPVSSIDWAPWAAVVAVVVGLGATLAGAALPAVRASRIPPIQALVGESQARHAAGRRRLVWGLVLFLPGAVFGGVLWFGNSSNSALAGLGAALTTIVMFGGMVALAPFVVMPLVGALARPLRRIMPAEGRLAADAARVNPGRTSATAATLLVALSVVVVNATVASSFVGSIRDELDRTLSRDLTVQPIGFQEAGPPQGGLSPRVARDIAALPQTGAVAARRSFWIQPLPGSDQQGLVLAYDPHAYARVDRIDYEGASRAAVLDGLDAGGVVLGKTYAQSTGKGVGDTLRLEGPSGVRTAPVVGIANTLDGGGATVQISLRTMAQVYGVTSDSQLVVVAASPGQRAELARRVDALLARSFPNLEALSNAETKANITDAIDQQFAFFNAIVAVAVVVGALGIVNTLSMSVLERTREIGVLRALGASRWRVRRAMADESLLLSLAGTAAGLLVGLVVALSWVVGLRLTAYPQMAIHLPAGTIVLIAALGVLIGVAAAALPARRAARLDPLGALRYE
jgi:putative ABC transport system permease protein